MAFFVLILVHVYIFLSISKRLRTLSSTLPVCFVFSSEWFLHLGHIRKIVLENVGKTILSSRALARKSLVRLPPFRPFHEFICTEASVLDWGMMEEKKGIGGGAGGLSMTGEELRMGVIIF